MSRDALHTVTLPVILDAEQLKDADGWAMVFPPPNRMKFVAVRAVNPKDIQQRLRKTFKPEEALLFSGSKQLRWAYDQKDELALSQSLERVRPWVPGMGSKKKHDWVGVRWIYSSLVSNLLQHARLVMWCSDKEGRFLPGVYCPDWKTAAFVMAFMEHIRVCPKCGIAFVPKDDKQDYCKPAHGVSYRTARSRWRAKQKKN